MNFLEVGAVKKAYNDFQNDTLQTKLRARWNEDFHLWRLKPYDAGQGYYSYTHNYPRVFADKAISMLTQSKLVIRLPIETLGQEEREQEGE